MHVSPAASRGLVLLLTATALALDERKSDTVDPGTASDCTYSLTARDSTWTCARFESEGAISHQDFVSWNPSVNHDCSGIRVGDSYCVEVNYGLSTETTTAEAAEATETTAIAQPSLTQAGMIKDCQRWYTAKAGDTCSSVVGHFGTFTLKDFAAWNPAVGQACRSLLSGRNYCVGVSGTPNAPTRTSRDVAPRVAFPRNGIVTPQPAQPDMVDNCVKFHYVSQGNVCGQITSYNGISQSDFAKWNPRVGAQCTGLWANAFACVGIAAFSLQSRYNSDCTGDVYNTVAMRGSEGYCMSTDCRVASLEIDADGLCPDGEVQLSYWENRDCTGKWFGYGYTHKGTCRRLWTDGWMFKAIHLRCAPSRDDCSSQSTCTMDPEPQHTLC